MCAWQEQRVETEEMAAAGDDALGEPQPWVEGATRPRRNTAVVSASVNQTSKVFECGSLSDYVESTRVGLHSTRAPTSKLPCGSACHGHSHSAASLLARVLQELQSFGRLQELLRCQARATCLPLLIGVGEPPAARPRARPPQRSSRHWFEMQDPNSVQVTRVADAGPATHSVHVGPGVQNPSVTQ